jgi:MbtH protein
MNPFDDASGRFRILVNEQEQYSLWPDDLDVPEGWESVRSGLGHQEALDYVEEQWTDLRPRSLREGDVAGISLRLGSQGVG